MWWYAMALHLHSVHIKYIEQVQIISNHTVFVVLWAAVFRPCLQGGVQCFVKSLQLIVAPYKQYFCGAVCRRTQALGNRHLGWNAHELHLCNSLWSFIQSKLVGQLIGHVLDALWIDSRPSVAVDQSTVCRASLKTFENMTGHKTENNQSSLQRHHAM